MALRLVLQISRDGMRRFWVMLALLLATLASFNLLDRYEPVGPALLPSLEVGPDTRWTLLETEGTVARDGKALHFTSTSADGKAGIREMLDRPSSGNLVRLTARLRWTNVEKGRKSWHAARIFVLQRTASGEPLWHLPHEAFREHGAGDWQSVAEVFRLSPKSTALVVGAEVSMTKGELWLADLALQPVAERPAMAVWRWCLAAAWVAWLLWSGWAVQRSTRAGPMRLLAFLAVLAILAGSLAPQASKTLLLDGWRWLAASPAVESAPPASPAPAATVSATSDAAPFVAYWRLIQKLGHFALFAVLSFAALTMRAKADHMRTLIFLLGFAAVAETLQLLTFDRDPELTDFGINLLGVLCGAGASFLWRRLLRGPAEAAP